MRLALFILLALLAVPAWAAPTVRSPLVCVYDDGTLLKCTPRLNFSPAGACTYNAAANRVDCTITGGVGGSGTSVILDLANDGANESTALTKLATTGDANAIFTEPTADKLLIDATKAWPKADALSANPADCGPDTYATTIAANGNLTCAGITDASIASTITRDSEVPSLETDPGVPLLALADLGDLCAGSQSTRRNAGDTANECFQAQPAGSYSGVGACTASTFATTLNAGAAPTCSNILDADLPSTITRDSEVPGLDGVPLAALADLGDLCAANESTRRNGGDTANVCFTPITATDIPNNFGTVSTSSGTSPVADTTSDTLTLSGTAPVVVTGTAGTDTVVVSLTQNAGTDVTADLEEETHASEHSVGGGDTITVTNLASACTDAQVLGGNAGGTGVECQTDDDVPDATDFGALALTGDVTSSGLATTIANLAVTGAKMANDTVTATQLAAAVELPACTTAGQIPKSNGAGPTWSCLTPGSGGGLDADTLDGLNSTAFTAIGGRSGTANNTLLSTDADGTLTGSTGTGKSLILNGASPVAAGNAAIQIQTPAFNVGAGFGRVLDYSGAPSFNSASSQLSIFTVSEHVEWPVSADLTGGLVGSRAYVTAPKITNSPAITPHELGSHWAFDNASEMWGQASGTTGTALIGLYNIPKASGTITLTDAIGVLDAPTTNDAGTTITNRTAVQVRSPLGSGAVTNNIGFDYQAQSKGTNKIAYRSQDTSAVFMHYGKGRFGDNTTPTSSALEVVGDVLLTTGGSLYGGDATTEGLSLFAHNRSWAAANTGRIRLGERVTVTGSYNITAAYSDAWIYDTSSWTTNNATYINPGYRYEPTIKYTTPLVVAFSPAFNAAPTWRNATTTDGADLAGYTILPGVAGAPIWLGQGTCDSGARVGLTCSADSTDATVGCGAGAGANPCDVGTGQDLLGFRAAPQARAKGVCNASTTGGLAGTECDMDGTACTSGACVTVSPTPVLTRMTGFGSFAPSAALEVAAKSVGAGVTVTHLSHFWAKPPQYVSGTLTNQYGLDLEDMTNATNNVGIVQRGTDDINRLAGATIIGNTSTSAVAAATVPTAASARLHVQEPTIGNEVLRVESVATNDDPNYRVFQGRTTTTGASTQTLISLASSTGQVYLLELRCLGICTSGSACTAGQSRGGVTRAVYDNIAGTLTERTETSDFSGGGDLDGAGAGAFCNFAVSGTNILAQITGVVNENATWHGTLIVQNLGS